jgi:endonuclease YncB( thermonuclease family)
MASISEPRIGIIASMRTIILLFAILLCGAARYPHTVLVGTVTRVVDGDTMVVELSSGVIRVRLYGIDAPEHNQPGGYESASVLRSLVERKQVNLEPINQDRYSRMVAKVFLGNTNVNAEMVSRGEAWVYRHYIKAPDRQWCAFEAQARSERKGLWKGHNVIPPWTFRHHTGEYAIPPCP